MGLEVELLLAVLFSFPPPGAAVLLSSFLTGLPLTWRERLTGINTIHVVQLTQTLHQIQPTNATC